MQPEAVVKANNVVSDIGYGFCMIGIAFLPDPLHLQIQEEAFYYSVDAPMSIRQGRIFQIGQDKGVKLANDVAL